MMKDAIKLMAVVTTVLLGSVVATGQEFTNQTVTASGGNNGFTGTGAADTVTFTGSSITVSGGGVGINLAGGADTLQFTNTTLNVSGGGNGITAGGANDVVTLENGTITVTGGGAGLTGSGGNDVITIGNSTFTITGGNGLNGGAGSDSITINNSVFNVTNANGLIGRAGNDIISLNNSVFNVTGGNGLTGGNNNDIFTITNSTINVTNGNNGVTLGTGNDTLTVNSSRIQVIGGVNAISGGGGTDTVTLNGFSDITGSIDGGAAADTLNLLNWRGVSPSVAAAIVAGGNGTYTIAGKSFTFVSFSTINASGFQTFSNLITAPGLSNFSSALDNINGSPDDGFFDIFMALNSISDADLDALAQTASGQVYQNAFSNIAFNNASRMTGDFFSQLRHQGRNAAVGADLTAFQWNQRDLDPLLVNMDNNLLAMSNPSLAAADTASLQAATMATASASNAGPYYEWQAFVIGSGSYAEQDAISGLAESETVSTSAIIGVGKNLSEALNAGGYIGYQGVNAEVDAFGSNAEGNGAQVGGYARYQWGDWLASGILGYNYTAYENERKIISPAFTGTGRSDADAHQLVSALELSRDFHFGDDGSIRVTPMAGLQYSLLHVEDFQESGLGSGGLKFDDQTAHSLRTKLGFEVAKTFEGDWGWLAPYVSAAWHHEFLDNSRDVTTSFIDPALASFTVSTREADSDFAVIGAGFNASLTEAENIHFTLGWQLQVGQEGYIVNSATGGVRVDL